MGNKISHPHSEDDNEAKATADHVFKLMDDAANNFFSSVRLGEPNQLTLGYPLTDMRLVAQERHIIVQTETNVTSDLLKKTIDDIFSGKWESVVEDVASVAVSFLTGGCPKPSDTSVNDDFSSSFLKFENSNVVQYSIYIKRSNSKSMGTLAKDATATLLTVICKGVVDYAKIDPQAVLEAMLASGIKGTQIDQAVSDLKDRIKNLAEVNLVKREIESGLQNPTENSGDKPQESGGDKPH